MNVSRAVATINGKEIPSQIDDLDHDGIPDELVMVIRPPGEEENADNRHTRHGRHTGAI